MRKTLDASISKCPEGLASSMLASGYALWKKNMSMEGKVQKGENQCQKNW